jgi:hypothetical protein|tara:strand:- start:432 stop:551 length:120 start_codon:yes stop_codon:yes gene_type:complete
MNDFDMTIAVILVKTFIVVLALIGAISLTMELYTGSLTL